MTGEKSFVTPSGCGLVFRRRLCDRRYEVPDPALFDLGPAGDQALHTPHRVAAHLRHSIGNQREIHPEAGTTSPILRPLSHPLLQIPIALPNQIDLSTVAPGSILAISIRGPPKPSDLCATDIERFQDRAQSGATLQGPQKILSLHTRVPRYVSYTAVELHAQFFCSG